MEILLLNKCSKFFNISKKISKEVGKIMSLLITYWLIIMEITLLWFLNWGIYNVFIKIK